MQRSNCPFNVSANYLGSFMYLGPEHIVLLIVGFIAVVTLGSVAWYNSKRPVGWEGTDKPDIVPDLTSEQKKWPN
ncbi:MAG: hypothetical protein WCA07_12500 [Gloeobacterales cyanobacterium]